MIAENLQDVRRRIAAAAQRRNYAAALSADRSPADVRLIAVSKTHPASTVVEAALAGQIDFGENRVQEALEKIDALLREGSAGQAAPEGSGGQAALEWHLIGHLQTNKAKKAAVAFAWIHSVDSVELIQKLDAAALAGNVRPKILLQLDLAREATKSGAQLSEVPALIAAARSARAVQLSGLMIVPPIVANPEDARPWFKQLRDIRDTLVTAGTPAASLKELSMGMSHDFEVAVEEGATMVRVGSAIFGQRDYPAQS